MAVAPSARARTDLLVERVETERDLLALRDEWDPLVNASGSANLFLSWSWISTWWDHYGSGQTLSLLTARDATGQLVGIAPLKRRRRALLGLPVIDVLEFIGYGGDVTPERLDFIVKTGMEGAVVPRFMDSIATDTRTHSIDLRPLALKSPNLPYIEAALTRGQGRVQKLSDAVCPIMPLPETWEQFLAGRSKNYRKKMKEYQRRCERDLGARIRISSTAVELSADLDALARLHGMRWEGRSRAFRSDLYLQFHKRLAGRLLEKQQVRMFALDTDSGPIAMLYCFSDGDRYYYYQAGRDPACKSYRVGLVLMHRAIEQAIKEKARIFDFLRGKEDYKYMWAVGDETSVRLAYWRSWPAWAVTQFVSVVDHAQAGISTGTAAVMALADRGAGMAELP